MPDKPASGGQGAGPGLGPSQVRTRDPTFKVGPGKTHLSWTLNAELRGLSFKPQALGATKGFSMVKVMTRRVREGSGNSEWDS